MAQEHELIPHLFRTEYRKIVSVLIKRFGFDRIEIAEDIASDTFLSAAETWGLKGLPDNPQAWLYAVAKNKARNVSIRRARFAEVRASEIADPYACEREDEIDLTDSHISDSQLQMMFAICTPVIPPEAQIALSLRVLCGFGIEEIADAFLTNKETINKRLFRAKERLRKEGVRIELPGRSAIDNRLSTVLKTLYLLFNEGYYSTSQDITLRKDLCLEAMRLNYMLVEENSTDRPSANALLALMCFHASRFDARTNENGEMILYDDQDEHLWNKELVDRGIFFLNKSSETDDVSTYHLEAAIAFWHTQKKDSAEKWEHILQLYNRLLQIEYSPMVALNRTYALSKARGVAEAIAEAEKLQLSDSHFYYVLLGELYSSVDRERSKAHYKTAYSLAKTQSEKRTIKKRL